MEEILRLKKRKQELEKAVEFTKQKKKQIVEIAQKLASKLGSRTITRERYEEELKKALKNRTAEQWIKYYEDYLDYYDYQIKLCDRLIKQEKYGRIKEIAGEKAVPALKICIVIATIALIFTLIFILKPAGIGVFEKIGEKVSVSIKSLTVPEEKPETIEAPKVFEEPKVPVILEDKNILIKEESLIQYQAVLGKNVRWKKQFAIDGVSRFTVELPKDSENIKVKIIENGEEKDITEIAGISKKRRFFIFEKGVEVEIKEQEVAGITGNVVDGQNANEQEFEITYETRAPEIFELEAEEGAIKKVVIKGPDEVHYRNILSFTELPREFNEKEIVRLKLYEIKNSERIETKFIAYDTDENGLYDYVEWLTPELSEAVFEFVIEITKAEHLDSEKNFINDIYEQVYKLDDIWSEQINDGEYVRVTFFKKLDNTRDITIYPRVVSGNPAIEIYEINGSEKIAEFTSLQSNEYNKVFLTNLKGEQDVFDLKIIGGSIEIEHIIDPSGPPNISFVTPPTPNNGDTLNVDNFFVNVSSSDESQHYTFLDFNKDLVLWMRMDDVNQTGEGALVYDNSSYGNNGIAAGNAVQNNSGKFGKSFSFDGTGDSIRINDIPGLQGNVTVAGWIYTNDLPAYGRALVYSQNEFRLQIVEDKNRDKFAISVHDGLNWYDLFSSTEPVTSTWYHLALVSNASGSRLYVNGIQEGSNLDYSIIDRSTNIISIGVDLNGLIDDVLIFKRDLTDREIKALYNATANKYYRNFTNLPNGNYNLRAYAVDIYDKINKTEERNISIDKGFVNQCKVLDIVNSVYTLTANVSSPGTCFNVTANNVTLNCNGYEINYSYGGGNSEYGVYSNKNFTTIKNCKIKEGAVAGDSDYGIYFNKASNGTIYNNTIATFGKLGRGVYLLSNAKSNNISFNIITTSGEIGFGIHLDTNSDFNIVSNNIITTSGSSDFGTSADGIRLSFSASNTFLNNAITTSGIFAFGIYLHSGSTNTLLNNTITTSGSSASGIYLELISNSNLSFNKITTFGSSVSGIYLFSNSNNNSFLGMNIKTNGSFGNAFYVDNTNHNFTIRDSILNTSYATRTDFYVSSGVTGGVWNFTNVTRSNGSPINISWSAGSNGTLNMKWYLDVNVTDSSTGNAIENANVSAGNKDNFFQFSVNTTATGLIPRQTLLEYTNVNNTLKTYFSNYTVNVTKAGYQNYSNSSVNLTNNLFMNVKLLPPGTATCGVLNTPNSIYTLTGDIIDNTLTGPCINITAQNITLDCRGYYIKSDDAVIGVYSNQLNTTIKNCNISMGSAVAGRGIFLYGANDSYIYNNYLHDQYAGLFSQSFSVRVLNNTLVGHSFGMEFNNVNGIGNNTIANNTVNGGSYGIQLFQTFNNLVTGNKITSVTGSGGGIVIGTNAKDNYLINNVVVNNNIGVSLSNSFNNIFADSNFSQNTQNVYLESTSTNNTFLNCSYDNSGTKESVSAGSQLIRKWYYQANVTDGINPIINANVSAYNVSGNWQFNLTTKSSGLTNITTITDYVNNGTRNYYSPYTINTTNGSLKESHSLNVTERALQAGFGGAILDNIILSGGDTTPPAINFVPPTPLNGSSPLDNNIFVNVSASDFGRGGNNISTFIDFDNSLVGWWRMDDLNSSGGVIDYTGKNNGTAKGNAVQTDAGKFGKGFSFDGVSGSCINIGEPSSLDVNFTQLTLSAWFKRASSDNINDIALGKFNVWYLGALNDTSLRFRHLNAGDGFTDLIVPSIGTSWHHMVAIFNGTNTFIYLDGVYRGGEVACCGLGTNGDSVGIGANEGGGNNALFNGIIDDVMIFNRSLSAEEIKGLYANASSRYLGVNFTNLTERNYTFKAYAQDTFGNVNSTEKREVNVNFGPKIIWVQNLGNVMGFAGGIRNITINFTVFDFNGFADLNDSSANANFTKEGVVRNKINCSKIVGWDKYANYSCIIGMWYYDKGGNWNINISIADKKGNWGINNSNSFYYEYLYSFDMVPNYVNWSNMEIGMTNKSADNNMTIRNRGNVNIINATINATNLNGTVNPSQFIPAANFTFSNSSFNSCSGSRLIKNQNVSVALFINYSKSINYNYANNTLSFCLKGLPAGISAQEYKTETGKDWDINVIFGFFISMKYALLAVAVVIKKRKSRKKRYLLNQEELLSLDEKLKEKYKTNIRELLGAVEKDRIKKEIQVPADIFKGKISPAEALCKYLRENIRLRFSEIARLLERDERTIWINYRNAAKKMKEKIRAGKKLSTPIDIFSNRKLSILESVVNYLKEKGFRNYEIAELLGKDQRNIYTLYNRAKKKLR